MSESKKLNLKKIVPILVVCVLLVSIFAAYIYTTRIQKGHEKYDLIRTSHDTEEQVWSDWHYNGAKYSVAPGLYYRVLSLEETEESGLHLISWNWYVPLLGKWYIYGDEVDNPNYIVCHQRGEKYRVRVRENFDYMDEEYVIYNEEITLYDIVDRVPQYEWIRTDTELSFKIKDVYYADECIQREAGTEPIAYFRSHSKSFDKLIFHGRIFIIDGEYYVNFHYNSTRDTEQTYKAKPVFIELLRKAGELE